MTEVGRLGSGSGLGTGSGSGLGSFDLGGDLGGDFLAAVFRGGGEDFRLAFSFSDIFTNNMI